MESVAAVAIGHEGGLRWGLTGRLSMNSESLCVHGLKLGRKLSEFMRLELGCSGGRGRERRVTVGWDQSSVQLILSVQQASIPSTASDHVASLLPLYYPRW